MPPPRIPAVALGLLALGTSIHAAHAASDGGGRDVSVVLFSAHPAHQLTITPLGPAAWTAKCLTCRHDPLTQPITLPSATELFAGGSLRVTDSTTHDSRTAAGLWHLRSSAPGTPIDVVLTLPSERYVAAVLNAESSRDEPAQSLRALAIVVRTYALNGKHFTAQPGHLDADLCDSTACQAMSLQPVSPAVEDAVRSTTGETLWAGLRRAEVYFSQSCGGFTEDASAVWPSPKRRTYLTSHPDPYCERRIASAWHAQIPLSKLPEIAASEGWHLPSGIAAVRVAQRSASHRAVRIAFVARDGSTATVNAPALRLAIGRTLGWNLVRSDSYELNLHGGSLVFDGRGHGHGVGLCQVGAAQMATEGKSSAEILSFYFPGTAVRITPTDVGWKELRTPSLTIRSTQAAPPAQQAGWQKLWQDAQQRFAPAHAVSPKLIFAPTTELFRQLTNGPGWALASTQGDTTVLQPASAFHTPGSSQQQTLLHEMLHLSVETACNNRTPLWLREGLVEVLAGEHPHPASTLPLAAVEASLHQAASLQESQRAHMAAAAKVQTLLARYSMSTVRGWLSSGVPPSALER